MMERLLASRLLRLLFVAAAVALCVGTLVRYWGDLTAAASDLDPLTMIAAVVAAIVGTGLAMLGWRQVLAALGSPLPLTAAVRVYSLAQIGKYIPGSVWPFLAQVELGKEHGVPRIRSASALALTIITSVVSALLVAAVTLPFTAGDVARRYWWGLAAAPFLLALLHPAVLNPLVDRLLRLARRPPLERPLTRHSVAIVVGWSVSSWVAFGLHVFVLARALGGSGLTLLPASIGTYALAWAIGFLVVIAPAGAGVREVVLVAGLSATVGRAPVILLAVASRLVITVADLAWAAFGLALGRAHLRQVPDERLEAEALRRARREAPDAA